MLDGSCLPGNSESLSLTISEHMKNQGIKMGKGRGRREKRRIQHKDAKSQRAQSSDEMGMGFSRQTRKERQGSED